jgi:ABC-type transporter Mla subunit MlaD
MKIKTISDWLIAFAVVASSILLFVALAMALQGSMTGRSSHRVAVDFVDVMGVNRGAQVKLAGARVGTVSGIRLLTAKERIASGDPRNVVRVTLSLKDKVPELASDITVSVAADTLLSDKVILLSGGTAGSPRLSREAVLQGISPVTIDALVRNLGHTLEGLQTLLGGSGGDTQDLIQRLQVLVAEVQGLVDGAKPLVEDGRGFVSEVRQILAENKEPLSRTLTRLDHAVGSFDQLASRAEALIRRNDKSLTETLADLNVTVKNFKVSSTYLKVLTHTLAQRPAKLIWGGKPPALPAEDDILRARGPVKVGE